MSIKEWTSVSSWKNWAVSKWNNTRLSEDRSIVPIQGNIQKFSAQRIEVELLDPTITENALKILNLQQEDLQYPERLQKNYDGLIKYLSESETKLPALYAQVFRARIENAQKAYTTLGGKN